ncbi:MAG TPA: amino acid permease [Candidatus Saccharimonadales bacterium]|nr:amino acid permease [Candidatus Saccharimonadales bacterium]
MAEQTLKRNLSLPLITLYGLGNILGAGIYVLVGKVAGYSGENTILAFLVAMVIAGLTAFSYMELSSRYPQSASVSVYLHKAFGKKLLSTIVGLALVLGGIASAAALTQGFAGYLGSIFSVPELLASIGLLVFLALVAAKGIGESAKFAAIFTVVEVVGLLMIIWAGRNQVTMSEFISSFSIDPAIGISGVLFGAFLAFYAFIGFEDMVNVVEEVKKPRITMPLAILLSLVAATVLYLLVVLVSMAAVSPAQLAASDAPLSLVFSKVSNIDPLYISVIGIAATVNGVLVQIIMGSRILYGLSKQGWIHARFSAVHAKYGTPIMATAVVTAAMITGTLLLNIVSLAQATSYLILIVFTLVNVSLIVMKRRDTTPKAGINVPFAIPVLGALSCIGVVGYQLLGAG